MYEPKKFIIFPSFVPITPFYDKETDAQQKKRVESLGKQSGKELRLCNGLIQPITYTPDIYVKYNDLEIGDIIKFTTTKEIERSALE